VATAVTISCYRTTTIDAIFFFCAPTDQVGVFPIVENGDFEKRTRQGVEKRRNGGESWLQKNWQWEKVLTQLPDERDTFIDLCHDGCYKEYDDVHNGDYDNKFWYGFVLLS